MSQRGIGERERGVKQERDRERGGQGERGGSTGKKKSVKKRKLH